MFGLGIWVCWVYVVVVWFVVWLGAKRFYVWLVLGLCMVDVFGELLTAVAPVSTEMLLWELLAFSASLLFFKELDYDLQQTEWFKGYVEDKSVRGIVMYRLVKVLLDGLHHWWAGLGLILYSPEVHLRWVGAGLLVADLPDFKRRFDDILRIIGENLANSPGE